MTFVRNVLSLMWNLNRLILTFVHGPRTHRFWKSGNGTTVAALVPESGKALALFFQRPLTRADVKEGRLLPVTWAAVKRRGGKRQTELLLSLESAEMLHEVLGRALKDARSKRQHAHFTDALMEHLAMLSDLPRPEAP